MKEDNTTIKSCSELVIAVVAGLLICFIISLCSCKAQREIQIERVEVPVVVNQEHTVESVKIEHVRDTVIQRDSIFHFVQGDTVRIERWHYTQGVTNIYKTDTLHIYDSIPYPVEAKMEKNNTIFVEKELSYWQQLKMNAGMFFLSIIFLIIIGFIGWLVWKKKKH